MKVLEIILRRVKHTWMRVLVGYYTEMAFSDKMVISEDVTVNLDYRDPAFELKIRREGYMLPGEPVCHHPPGQRHRPKWLVKMMTIGFNFQHTLKVSAQDKELVIGHGQKSLLLSTFDGTPHYSGKDSWLRKLLYKVAFEDPTEALFRDVVWGARETEPGDAHVEETETQDTAEAEVVEAEVDEAEVVDTSEGIVVELEEPAEEVHEERGMDIDFSFFR